MCHTNRPTAPHAGIRRRDLRQNPAFGNIRAEVLSFNFQTQAIPLNILTRFSRRQADQIRYRHFADVDRVFSKEEAFTRFDVLALGEYVGPLLNPYRVEDGQNFYLIKPCPLGVLFELAPPGRIVPPANCFEK